MLMRILHSRCLDRFKPLIRRLPVLGPWLTSVFRRDTTTGNFQVGLWLLRFRQQCGLTWKKVGPPRWRAAYAEKLEPVLHRFAWRTMWSVFTCRYTAQQLQPKHELDQETAPGTWIATGHDPQFLLSTRPLVGWLRIRMRIRSDVEGRVMLYADHGDGFHDTHSWTIGSLRAGRWVEIQQSYWLEEPISLLRFDPVDKPAKLVMERFEVACLPRWKLLWDEYRPRLAVAYARGALGSRLGTLISLLARGDFEAMQENLTNLLYPEPDTFDEIEYRQWREEYQPRLAAVREDVDERVPKAARPKVSLLFCPQAAPFAVVRRTIESLWRQTHLDWELCVAFDPATTARVRRWLARQATWDRRLRIASKSPATATVTALNHALSLASGDMVGRLSPGNELARHALLRATQACVAHPESDVVYSDEDCVTELGRHSEPFFKPDWSPEHLLASNYLGPFTLFRTSRVRAVGGYREEFVDAVDYDLALRCITPTSRVHHIADVLCHRGDTSGNERAPSRSLYGMTIRAEKSPRVVAAERQALQSYLNSTGQAAIVESGLSADTHRVRWSLRGQPSVSIVIPSACRRIQFQGKSTWLALECVQSIRRLTTYPRVEVLVVDDNSLSPELEAELKRLDVRPVRYRQPFNFSAKINLGASEAQGEHLILLNDDIEVLSPDWIECLLEFSQQDDIGSVGAKLLFPNGELQHVGVTILKGNPGHKWYRAPADHPGYFHGSQIHRNCVAVTGACLMTRTSVFRELGGFDVGFPLNYNDVDYCLRVLESGRRNVYTPFAQFYHHESLSKPETSLEELPEELAIFKNKWGQKYHSDPFYNPNLTMTRGDYSLITMDAA